MVQASACFLQSAAYGVAYNLWYGKVAPEASGSVKISTSSKIQCAWSDSVYDLLSKEAVFLIIFVLSCTEKVFQKGLSKGAV